MSDSGKELALARKLAKSNEKKDRDMAWQITARWMDADPNDPNALSVGSYILHENKEYGLAYQLAKRATELAPGKSEPLSNLGRTTKELGLNDESENAFRASVQFAENQKLKSVNLSNLAGLFNDTGRFKEAEKIAQESIRLGPDNQYARGNYGVSLLGQLKWDGWDYYRSTMGISRQKRPLGYEPEWGGEKGKNVFFYSDQGLGDEISFSSMLPQAIGDCKKAVVECDPKLEGLFRRSFDCEVYGTRNKRRNFDFSADASLSFGDLGLFYCKTNPSGRPFLKSDPQRRLMWRALFNTKKKPVIGVAWTGGVRHTGSMFREVSLEELLPIFKSVDAHFVSLQYHDAKDEIEDFKRNHPKIDIVQYSFATLTDDYDDTAALVSECDVVVSMQTAVVHLCGALGKECLVLLPKRSQWRYGEEGNKTVWYDSVKLYRQKEWGDWKNPIHRIKDELSGKFLQQAA